MCNCEDGQECNCISDGKPITTIYIPVPGEKGDRGERGKVGPIGPRGIDGVNGINGTNGTSGGDGVSPPPAVNQFVYKLTTTNVRPTPPTSAWTTEGWFVDMMDVTVGSKYRWVSMRTIGATGIPNDFSSPVLDGIYATGGLPGEKGKDGSFRDVIFRVNGSITSPPSITNTDTMPDLWSRVYPTGLTTGQYIWRSEVWKDGDGELIAGNVWSPPYRMTSVDGAPGAPGSDGAPGTDGKSVSILGTKATVGDLPPTGVAGDGWIIGQDLWVWSSSTSTWINAGEIKGPAGNDGASVQIQYSVAGVMADNSSWFGTFVAGHRYMRMKKTNESVWQGPFLIVGTNGSNGAPGPAGAEGNGIIIQFAMNNSLTVPPDTNTGGWTNSPPALIPYNYIWMRQGIRNPTTSVVTWQAAIRITSPEAKPAPILIWRDVFNISTEYQGTPQMVQAVKYGGTHYITRTDAPGTDGKFSGQVPGGSNNLYWNVFEVDVASIAAGFLFVDSAFVNNLTVSNLQTSSDITRVEIKQLTNDIKFIENSVVKVKIGSGVLDEYGANVGGGIEVGKHLDKGVLITTTGISLSDYLSFQSGGKYSRVIVNSKEMKVSSGEFGPVEAGVTGAYLNTIEAKDGVLTIERKIYNAGIENDYIKIGAYDINMRKAGTNYVTQTVNLNKASFNSLSFVNGLLVSYT